MTALQHTGGPTSDVRQTIGDIARTVLDRDIDPSLDVFDQGATSLAFIRIVAEIHDRYGITVDVADLEEASVNALSALVAHQLQSQVPVTAGD